MNDGGFSFGRSGGAVAPKAREATSLTPRQQHERDVARFTSEVQSIGSVLAKLRAAEDPAVWDVAKADLDRTRERATKALEVARAHDAPEADLGARLAREESKLAELTTEESKLGARPDGIKRVALETELDAIRERAKDGDRGDLSPSEWARSLNDQVKAVVDRLAPEDWDRLAVRIKSPRDGDELARWLATRSVRDHVVARAGDHTARYLQRAALASQERISALIDPPATYDESRATIDDGAASVPALPAHQPGHVTTEPTVHVDSPRTIDRPAEWEESRATIDDGPAVAPSPRTSSRTRQPRKTAHEPSKVAEEEVAEVAETSDTDHNAFMSARAYDERGSLLDLWSGPAFFHGELPAEFVAKKKKDHWHWTVGGVVAPNGRKLKIDSDEEGKTGTPVGDWAPVEAAMIAVSFHGLSTPFGLDHVVVDPSGPLSMIGQLTLQSADGTEPASLDAPGMLHGPAAPGTTLSSGDLIVEQADRETTFWLNGSLMQIIAGGKKSEYAFTVRAQTSPTQRVVDVVGTDGVWVDLSNDPSAPQFVYHFEHVAAGHVPVVDPDAVYGEGVLPEIQALSDGIRCRISMGEDVILIEAVEAGAKFAYWVDAEWSGEHGEDRAVHVVATPGVRVDAVSPSAGGPTEGRRLVASPIYVQNPDLVPKQGTPIDPADFLRADSLQYGATDKDTVTAFTGTSGVTLVDKDLGVHVSIVVADPTKGARFAWYLDKPEDGGKGAFRALVGPGVQVHVLEGMEPAPEPMGPKHFDYQDFGVDIDLHETDDPARIPPQGTALTADLLSEFAARKPDSRAYKDAIGALETGAAVVADLVIGMVPGVGDIIDLAEAFGGTDKWGNELSATERVVMAIAAVIPLLPGAVAKAGRFAGKMAGRAGGKFAHLAATLGKSEEEVEVLLAQLRRLDDDSKAAARRVEHALRSGADVDPADLAKIDDGLRRIGIGGLPDTKGAGDIDVLGDAGPRVPVPDDYPVDEAKRLDDVAEKQAEGEGGVSDKEPPTGSSKTTGGAASERVGTTGSEAVGPTASEKTPAAKAVDELIAGTESIQGNGPKMMKAAKQLSAMTNMTAAEKVDAILGYFNHIGFAISNEGVVETAAYFIMKSEDSIYAFKFMKDAGQMWYGKFEVTAMDYVWRAL